MGMVLTDPLPQFQRLRGRGGGLGHAGAVFDGLVHGGTKLVGQVQCILALDRTGQGAQRVEALPRLGDLVQKHAVSN